MRILVDSADISEVREAVEAFPFVNGCTTNAREVAYHTQNGESLADYAREMRKTARGILHFQVTTADTASMVAEGRAIAKIGDEIRVKIPANAAGIRAIYQLAEEGIDCAATACDTLPMSVLAAKAGAKSVISYYGVIEDMDADGGGLLDDQKEAFDNYGYKTEIMFFARNAKQARRGMLAGVDGCLMTLAGLYSLLDDPLSTREIAFMNSEWRRIRGDETWCGAK